MTRPDYCPVAQEPCQAMCALSDVRCKIRDTHPPKREFSDDEFIKEAKRRGFFIETAHATKEKP